MSKVKNDKDAAQGTPGVIHDGADQSCTPVHPDPFSNLEELRDYAGAVDAPDLTARDKHGS